MVGWITTTSTPSAVSLILSVSQSHAVHTNMSSLLRHRPRFHHSRQLRPRRPSLPYQRRQHSRRPLGKPEMDPTAHHLSRRHLTPRFSGPSLPLYLLPYGVGRYLQRKRRRRFFPSHIARGAEVQVEFYVLYCYDRVYACNGFRAAERLAD
jgi:hypothetical protein